MKLYTTDREFYRKTLKYAVPITLQTLITIGVNMTANIMVGALGENSLSAVALANQFINICSYACIGLGQGASILATRYWGMRENGSLKKTIAIAVRYCFAVTLIFTLAAMFFPRMIMCMYISDDIVIAEGVKYLSFSAYSFIFMGLSLIGSNALRSVGKVKIPLYTSMLAFVVNIGFSYILIYGKFGFPMMGVGGAALGTLLSRIIECVITFGYLIVVDKSINYRIRDFLLRSKQINREFVKIALPVMISDTLQGFGNNFIAMISGRVGSQFVAAFSITTIVQQLSTVFTQGVANASGVIVGHTFGSGNVKKAKEEADAFVGLGIVVGIAAAVIIVIISRPIISCYNIEESTQIMTQQLMNAIAFIVLFRSINSILTKGVLRGGGDTRFLMIADIIFLWIASVPLGYLVGVTLHASAFWTYCTLKIDEILKCILCYYRLKSGKWVKTIKAENKN